MPISNEVNQEENNEDGRKPDEEYLKEVTEQLTGEMSKLMRTDEADLELIDVCTEKLTRLKGRHVDTRTIREGLSKFLIILIIVVMGGILTTGVCYAYDHGWLDLFKNISIDSSGIHIGSNPEQSEGDAVTEEDAYHDDEYYLEKYALKLLPPGYEMEDYSIDRLEVTNINICYSDGVDEMTLTIHEGSCEQEIILPGESSVSVHTYNNTAHYIAKQKEITQVVWEQKDNNALLMLSVDDKYVIDIINSFYE